MELDKIIFFREDGTQTHELSPTSDDHMTSPATPFSLQKRL